MKNADRPGSKEVVTFGEVMMRLSPPGHLRLSQVSSLEVTYGGSEANVAMSLAGWGVAVEHVTRLPENDLGRACFRFVQQFGVGLDHVAWGGDRLGLYFYELGAAQRPSTILYDRDRSAFAALEPGMLPWQQIFADAAWFHWTGITPAVSASAAEVCVQAARTAQEMGLTVSCDLNFRGQLWGWGRLASEVMAESLPFAHVLIGNPTSIAAIFGVDAGHDVEGCRAASEELAHRFPGLRLIAITLRGARSASHHAWSAVLWTQDALFASPGCEILPVVDRMGAGDAFTAGLIYGLIRFGEDRQRVLDYAVAASCLKHSIWGDCNLTTVAEVEEAMRCLRADPGG